MLSNITTAIAIVAVAVALAAIWAAFRRSAWLLPLEVVTFALSVVLIALNVAERVWWLAAFWAFNAALSGHTVYRIRRDAANDSDEATA